MVNYADMKKSPSNKKLSARRVAFDILRRVDETDAYADILLARELPRLESIDRGLATELLYGVLRWRIKVDWIIDSFSNIKTTKLDESVLTALRLGIYQMFFLTKIPVHSAVSESVELIKAENPRLAGFVNAVLRSSDRGRESINFPSIKREPVKYISVLFSHPEWMVERWIESMGVKDAIALCQANLRPARKNLRVNTLRATREELLEELKEEGFDLELTEFSPEGLRLLDKSNVRRLLPDDARYYIQDEASQLVAHLLAPKPGEVILDACAAPGGKTTHMAELMGNDGRIYAIDKHRARLKSVVNVAKRLGVNIITPVAIDATKLRLQPKLKGVDTPVNTQDGLGLNDGLIPEEGFDGVLVDAPCSGLGVLRRTPDIKYKRTLRDIKDLAKTQLELLTFLAGFVKEGGRLVYSVCTLEREETDMVIDKFLASNADFTLERADEVLPDNCKRLVDSEGRLRTLPSRDDLDGFFAVCLSKKN